MADLFSTKPVPPLAELMRPQALADVVGQRHLLGPGKPLRLAFESRKLHSFILWGPPGVGKTTLGRLAAKVTNSHFIAISAVLAGIKDIRAAIDEAQDALDREGRQTVVFVDEIHSFNKTQQDALLPHVESGLLTLIGGTTEHPGMQVTNALLSRAQVYNLQPLAQEDFRELYERARTHLPAVTVDDDGARAAGRLRRRRRPALPEPAGTGHQRGHRRPASPRWTRPSRPRPPARRCAAPTRAATRTTSRSRPSTSRCAARSPTPRCTGSRACSMAASTRARSRAA